MVSWLMTIKAVLISSGVASVGLFLKLSVPLAVDLAPILWSSLLTWLKPPYLYLLTNGIIITIVASSKYYRSTNHHEQEDDEIVYGGGDGDYKIQTEIVKDLDPDAQFGFVAAANPPSPPLDTAEEETEPEVKSVIMVESSDLVGSGGDHDVMLPPANSNRSHLPLRIVESENLPPADSRFRRRKSVTASEEGGRAVLKVRKPKRNDTLENTWKMITEGKSTPLTKQFYRRSDTFSRGDSGDSGEAKPVYKKSETFRDRTNYYKTETETEKGKVRKEPSLSQDELNRRVEAFIKKFNEDMKLQRMESLRQYKEITGRAV